MRLPRARAEACAQARALVPGVQPEAREGGRGERRRRGEGSLAPPYAPLFAVEGPATCQGSS